MEENEFHTVQLSRIYTFILHTLFSPDEFLCYNNILKYINIVKYYVDLYAFSCSIPTLSIFGEFFTVDYIILDAVYLFLRDVQYTGMYKQLLY